MEIEAPSIRRLFLQKSLILIRSQVVNIAFRRFDHGHLVKFPRVYNTHSNIVAFTHKQQCYKQSETPWKGLPFLSHRRKYVTIQPRRLKICVEGQTIMLKSRKKSETIMSKWAVKILINLDSHHHEVATLPSLSKLLVLQEID